MSSEKYLGLPLWVWLIIIAMIAYNCFITTSLVVNERNCIKKEQFDNSNSIKIHNFNTNWCGYSKQFQPEWDKFSQNKIDGVIMIDAKCDDPKSIHAKKANEFRVNGFPTVVAEKNGKTSHYNGPRKEEALIKWVKDGCGF